MLTRAETEGELLETGIFPPFRVRIVADGRDAGRAGEVDSSWRRHDVDMLVTPFESCGGVWITIYVFRHPPLIA